MKKIILLAALGLTYGMAQAQISPDAKTVLDATAAHFTQNGGVKATFKADNFVKGKMQGSAEGTMLIQGEKFQMTTPDMITWYDGQTQWSYVKANEEVNVSTPTPKEQQSMNPYAVVNLYKEGYGYQLKETTLRGKADYEVTLTAKDKKKEPHTIIINIDRSSYEPMCIRIQQRDKGQWTRISVQHFQAGQTFSASDFKFNPKDYPKAEVIDLR
ncbi:MAG: hypothetical protein LUC45_02945 [Paraprevotella sp.]|nr:hypothetical protein [Paraprevotella sp.]